MKKFTSSIVVLCVLLTYSLFASVPTVNDPLRSVVIPDGTEILAVTTEVISSKTAVEDDPITFKVEEDVMVNGTVVITKGTAIKGIVTNAKKAGFLGKGGELNIKLETTTTVDGQKLRVRAAKGKEGENKVGTTIALTVLLGPVGLLKKGKNAEIKAGTKITVFTDEEKTVNVVTP